MYVKQNGRSLSTMILRLSSTVWAKWFCNMATLGFMLHYRRKPTCRWKFYWIRHIYSSDIVLFAYHLFRSMAYGLTTCILMKMQKMGPFLVVFFGMEFKCCQADWNRWPAVDNTFNDKVFTIFLNKALNKR